MARDEYSCSDRILWPICLRVYPQAKCLALHTIANIFQGKISRGYHEDNTAPHITFSVIMN